MMTGTYIGLRASSDTQKLIEDTYRDVNIGNTVERMHITLIYDPKTDKIKEYQAKPQRDFKCKVTGVDIMGTGKWRALVLHLECPQLVRRHMAARKVYGFTHGYPKFLLHCSVKYNPSAQDLKIFKANTDLIGKSLVFNGEYVETLTED